MSKTIKIARKQVRELLSCSLKGSSGGVKENVKRAEKIAEMVFRKFQIYPSQWQLKHVKWVFNDGIKHLSNNTRYNYCLTIQKILDAQESPYQWYDSLKGTWCSKPTA